MDNICGTVVVKIWQLHRVKLVWPSQSTHIWHTAKHYEHLVTQIVCQMWSMYGPVLHKHQTTTGPLGACHLKNSATNARHGPHWFDKPLAMPVVTTWHHIWAKPVCYVGHFGLGHVCTGLYLINLVWFQLYFSKLISFNEQSPTAENIQQCLTSKDPNHPFVMAMTTTKKHQDITNN